MGAAAYSQQPPQLPISSRISNRAASPALTSTPFTIVVLNPFASTLTSYLPPARSFAVYCPASSTFRVTARFVAIFVIVIVAFATTAPDASVTVPPSVQHFSCSPPVCCIETGAGSAAWPAGKVACTPIASTAAATWRPNRNRDALAPQTVLHGNLN